MPNKLTLIYLILITCVFYSNKVLAFGIQISPIEFKLLHRTCQLFYASTSTGRRYGFAEFFLENELKKANIQAENTGGAWHYCAGVALLSRVKHTTQPDKKISLLRKALGEIEFTARKVPKENSMYGEIQLNLARALYQLNQLEKSNEVLNKLIETHPHYVPGYIELAQQYDKQGKTTQAIAILNKVEPKLQAISADFNYFIGIYYYKIENYEQAKHHAKVAYSLGYPLPGLRRLLLQKGYSIQ